MGLCKFFNSKVVKGQFIRRPGENEAEFKAFLAKMHLKLLFLTHGFRKCR